MAVTRITESSSSRACEASFSCLTPGGPLNPEVTSRFPLDRRLMVAGAGAALGSFGVTMRSVQAATHSFLEDPKEQLRGLARLIGDAGEPREIVTWFAGDTFAVEGDLTPLTRMFRTEGFCLASITGENDDTYRVRERRVTFLKDPKTEEILESWVNPLTGATHAVEHRYEAEQVITLGTRADGPTIFPWVFNDTKAIVVIRTGATQVPANCLIASC